MGFLSRFESKVEDTMEGAANRVFDAPISPVQISKKAEKQMRREKIVGAGKQYAPTLYTVLVNEDDDNRMFGFYPTLAGEIETFLSAKAAEQGLVMDGQPLVRFIVDESLRHGKFDVIAEPVAAPIIAQLRQEEMQRYGIASAPAPRGREAYQQPQPEPRRERRQRPAVNNDPYAPSNDPYAFADPIPASEAGVAAAGAAAAAAGAEAVGVEQQRTQLLTDSKPAAGARLINTTDNSVVKLSRASMVCGRGQDCDVSVMDINASRKHALLTREAHGVWVIKDLGSVNGTLVNGELIDAPETLYEGDRITMGLTTYIFTMA